MESLTRRASWLVAPLLAAAVILWLLVRGGRAPALTPSAPVAATDHSAPVALPIEADRVASREPAPERVPHPLRLERTRSAPARPEPGTAPAGSSPAAPGSSPMAPALPAGPATGARSGSADSSSGSLKDETGWADTSVAKQLSRELMPLVSECILQAKARNPRLRGMLALTMSVEPADNGKVIVAATPENTNQIDDAELFECIRESSFSIEGLKAPHDFNLTIPID